jgi:hypothetical protein
MGSPGDGASMNAGMCSSVSWLSFRRIIDIPFEICVATLESWQRPAQDGELHIGQSQLRWPGEHDRDRCTYRIEVGLARGPLRPPLPMRLDIDRWYPSSSSRTALELIPCERVRPTAAYFRSGHHLLDSLTQSLLQHYPPQHLDRVPAVSPSCQMPATNPSTRDMRSRRSRVDKSQAAGADSRPLAPPVTRSRRSSAMKISTRYSAPDPCPRHGG